MTSLPQTLGKRPVTSRYLVSKALREQASALQRKGMTLTEIGRDLDLCRPAVVQVLYTEQVRS